MEDDEEFVKLNAAMNTVIVAMRGLRVIEKNLTKNPEIDEHIGKAYSELQKAADKIGFEVSIL